MSRTLGYIGLKLVLPLNNCVYELKKYSPNERPLCILTTLLVIYFEIAQVQYQKIVINAVAAQLKKKEATIM